MILIPCSPPPEITMLLIRELLKIIVCINIPANTGFRIDN